MRIYRRTDTKKWAYDVTVNGKRRRKSSFNTEQEAREAAHKLLKHPSQAPQAVLLVDYYKEWIEIHKAPFISKKATQRYYNSLNHLIDYFGSDIKMSALTRTEYQQFINHYASSHAKESTRKLHNCIRACFSDAVYEEMVNVDPTHNINISGVTTETKLKYMNSTDFKRLIAYCKLNPTKSRLLIYTLAVTGARFSEINKMRLTDFIDESTLHIKGTKTKAANRKIKVHPDDISYIKQTAKDLGLHAQIFNLSNNAVNKAFRTLQKRLDIDDYTLHSIRHTHASELIYQGVDINYVSKRLGHANISITLNIYIHLLEEHEHKEDQKTLSILSRLGTGWHESGTKPGT